MSTLASPPTNIKARHTSAGSACWRALTVTLTMTLTMTLTCAPLLVGCASGLLLSEAEELAELDELGEAVERYQGAVLTQPSWPKSAEDESPQQSEVRASLDLKLNARLTALTAQERWAEACELSMTRQRLGRFAEASEGSAREVLAALWRAWEARVSDVTRWGELPPLLEQALGACGVEEADSSYQGALGQLRLVVSVSLLQALERVEALSAPPSSTLTREALYQLLDELDARWRALRPLTPSLPPQLFERWGALMERARRPLWEMTLDKAQREGQRGLAWLLSVLLERLDEATFSAHVSLSEPLISLLISAESASEGAPRGDAQALSLTPLIEQGEAWGALSAQLTLHTDKDTQDNPQGAHSVRLTELTPTCERDSEEVAEEERLIDHYEERPTPRWREATLEVEEAQARFEALKANLELLTARLASEVDPIVRARLEAEVERSAPEVAREEQRLEEAERALKGLTPTSKEPVYVLFRYPATRWSLRCEVRWSLSLSSPQSLSLSLPLSSTQEASPLTPSTTLTHSEGCEDTTHKAYPQQRVKADPLAFPQSPQALREAARAQLRAQAYAWLEERVFELRAQRYRQTQHTSGEHLSLEQLDTLARLALTAPSEERAESLSRVLFEALVAHPLFGELTLTRAPLLLGDLRRYHSPQRPQRPQRQETP